MARVVGTCRGELFNERLRQAHGTFLTEVKIRRRSTPTKRMDEEDMIEALQSRLEDLERRSGPETSPCRNISVQSFD